MAKINENCYIGVDVSKDVLDVYAIKTKAYKQFGNHQSGIANLCKWLFANATVICESTGIYHKALVAALHQRGINVVVANPRQVRDFAKAKGLLAKTDKMDAKVLAEYGATLNPRLTEAKSAAEDTLSKYDTRIVQLTKMIAAERTRLSSEQDKEIKQSISRTIKLLQKELKKFEDASAALIKQDVVLTRKTKILDSAPGIGQKTAFSLVVNLPELGELEGKQISKLVGVAPLNRDSGKMRGTRGIWGGRAHVRHALYMPTLAAINCDKKLAAFYALLKQKGKTHNQAMIACMRRLLVIVNAMLKHDLLWQSNYT